MQILGIEKIGDTLYGCLDDGICYQLFSIEPGCPVELEQKYPKSDYNDYDSFTLYYSSVEPGILFLEEPFDIGAAQPEDLSYESFLNIWNTIWCSDSN